MSKYSLTAKAVALLAAAMLAGAPMAYANPDDQNNTEQTEEEQEQNQNGMPGIPDLNQGQQQRQTSTIDEYIQHQRSQGKNGVIYMVNGAPVCVLYGQPHQGFGAAAVSITQPVQYC